MQTAWRRARTVALVLLAIGATASSSRAVTYTFVGDCDTPCGGVTGSLSFDDAALVPGNPYPAPTAFSFDFGAVEISAATALSFGLFAFPEPAFPGVPVLAVVPADILVFGADVHTGETPQPSGEGGDGLVIFLDGRWVATGNGICSNAQCTFLTARTGGLLTGTGSWSTVPEPAAGCLLTAAWIGLPRRRRRVQPEVSASAR